MLTLNLLANMLERIISELRRRYGEVVIDKIVERKTKFEIYMTMSGRRVKVILDKRNVKVRVYSGLTGMDISLRRVFTREYMKELRMRQRGEESL